MIALIPKWVWGVVAVVLALIAFQCYRSRNQDKQADTDVAKSAVVDSQHKAQTDSSRKIDTAVAKVEHTRKASLDAANRTHAVADTMGQHAQTVRDSLVMWRSRDSTHVVENDSLRSVVRSDSLQKILLVTKADGWKAVADSAIPVMDALRKDLAVARSGCHILPFVPCPTRTEALAAGAIVGGLVARNNFRRR